MIFRTYLGLDVRANELRAVALRRKGKGAAFLGARIQGLPAGALIPSAREPNIRAPKPFSDAVREVLGPLAGPEDRIALCLPESAGRVLLAETETAFKTRDEGADVLRWQLKNSMPVDPKEVHLDYQVLERKENGRHRLVVAFIAKSILVQFEEVFCAAGYNPAIIDFHSLNLYNFYRSRIDMGENFVLLGVEGGILSFEFFQNRLLAFHRTREIEASPAGVFQELNRSLVGCRENFPTFGRATVFLHSDWEGRDSLLDPLTSLFEREVVLLDPHLERMGTLPLGLKNWQARGLVAAVGAAERMM